MKRNVVFVPNIEKKLSDNTQLRNKYITDDSSLTRNVTKSNI